MHLYKILIKDTEKGYKEKGEIVSCCSYHALEQFVMAIDPSNASSLESQIKTIKPGLDEHVLSAIALWECDDAEHNEDIQKILDIAKTEMKK